MVILYLAVVIIALYFAIKLLAPEIRKPTLSMASSIAPPADNAILKTERLEMMVEEKNKSIEQLQEECKVLQTQVQDFEKVKTLLEEEIEHLKEQNRSIKSGVPADQPKDNSIA